MTSDPRRRNQILLAPPQNDMEEEEEDEDELFEAPEAQSQYQPAGSDKAVFDGSHQNSGAALTAEQTELIRPFITPSPFPHHTSGPTSSRFRNAFTRVTASPTSEVEAWQALLTEVTNCYRSIQSKIHVMDAEVQLQLDWIESCYGSLLSYFPYSATNVLKIAEILYSQSAQVGEDQGPLSNIGLDYHRQHVCQAKLERLFSKTLGVSLDGTKTALPDESQEQDSSSALIGSEKIGVSANAQLGGMCTSSAELWILYIQASIRQAKRTNGQNDQAVHAAATKAYELALEHASFGFSNHTIWKAYLQYIKSRISDPQQMVTLRSVYQRLVCHPMTGLDQLWQEYEQFERQQSEALAQALVGEFTPKYQHARTIYLERNRVFNVQDLKMQRLATPPNSNEITEEHTTLQLWKTRTAYERTNPERLQSTDFQMRIRTAFKEMACAFTYHPEVWHMWSMWEETTGQGGIERAIVVLELAQFHIPDCTLLALTQAQTVELRTDQPKQCLEVMKTFLERAPNSLAFAAYQQMVRRYEGKNAARAVFAKARRVLRTANIDSAPAKLDEVRVKGGDGDETGTGAQSGDQTKDDSSGGRWMVTNRLDESIGTGAAAQSSKANYGEKAKELGKFVPGPITWHLYASHALIEHRLNHSPETAARVFELGLRKHSSFLTQPAYVLKYARLLLELQDTVNLRALLTRSLTACQGSKSQAVTSLWNMALQFESLVSIGDGSNLDATLAVERRRRAALLGPEMEDVATGSRIGSVDSVAIGAQKSTIAEQLIRQDGYDASSTIVSGMSRTVDLLDVMGLWGSHSVGGGESSLVLPSPQQSIEDDEVISGGSSDAAYHQRLKYARLLATGGSAVEIPGGESGSRLMSARARLQGASATASQNTALTMAIQNSPDWLRELLLLLPASRNRTPVLGIPPPHLTEMALASLRQNKLPAERPMDDNGKKAKTGLKHKLEGGDSSDEEGDIKGTGGYGTQFRSRQRARMAAAPNQLG